jgi:hypothetical protein
MPRTGRNVSVDNQFNTVARSLFVADILEDTPEAYANGPVCLQVMGQRYCEEKLLGILRTFDHALGRPHDYQV